MINGRPSNGPATPDLGELSRVETKGKLRRRFTAKKGDSENRKGPKRTKSFGGGTALSDYFRKRKEPTSPVHKRSPMKGDSSEESSISSSLNWSVPYDLPNVVEADLPTNRQHERLLAEHVTTSSRSAHTLVLVSHTRLWWLLCSNGHNFSFVGPIKIILWFFLKAHKKLYQMVCLRQNFQNGPILIISPTYSPSFFSEINIFWPRSNRLSDYTIWKPYTRANQCMF